MEVWKDVRGYEGKYQVSNLGNVKSLLKWSSVQNRYIQREKILKQYVGSRGYAQVKLHKNGIKLGLIHRLVADAFIPNPENKREVNHINGIKTDNRVENLEWNTSRENTIHAYKNGIEKHYTRQVIQFDLQGNIIKEWASLKDAEIELNIAHQNIRKCCVGERNSAGGYRWRYKEVK